MNARVLYHLARADFLERVRRYNFLITLAVTVYFAYICAPPNHGRYVTMEMSGHRPLYNSAFTAGLTAILTSIFLSLAGFYLVKNAIDRDLQTGVGQILAATRMSTPAYLLGKGLSNLAVLAAIIAAMPVLAGIMQLVRGEDTAIQVGKLLAPFVFIVLPVMAIVASLAVLFEAIPFLRHGLGNVVYFFLWITMLALVASHSDPNVQSSGFDLLGLGTFIPGIRAGCEAAFPGCGLQKSFNMGFNFKQNGVWTLTNFRWDGVTWTTHMLAGRLGLVVIGAGLCLLAATRFSRFDPAPGWQRFKPAGTTKEQVATPLAAPHASLAMLPLARLRFSFLTMVLAELRLALRGVSWWWYVVAAGLIVGEGVSPFSSSHFWLIAAWIWPLLIWSAMGTREERQRTAQLVFSTAHPLRRQLPACWMAGVAVGFAAGSGTGLRLFLSGDLHGGLAWMAGAVFIPTFALALGVCSGSSKLFEIAYLLLWYVGPVNQLPALDFTGGSAPVAFLAATLLLGALALAGRRHQAQG